jgi:hypothetical protein
MWFTKPSHNGEGAPSSLLARNVHDVVTTLDRVLRADSDPCPDDSAA